MLRKGLVIYEPKGRAGEYSPLALNLYKGCGHGCIYCYAPDATFTDREKFKEASPRPNIIKRLLTDAPKAAADGATGNVLLCFTCDAYQPIDDMHQLARQAIQILHENGFGVTILTKGGARAYRDFDLLGPGDQFATTLTFLDQKRSLEWEPGAATPAERVASLRHAHELGIETWASLEPVMDPAEAIKIIRHTHEFVDLFKIGKINYTGKLPDHLKAQVKEIDWRQFARDVISELEKLGSKYYLKNDLKAHISDLEGLGSKNYLKNDRRTYL